MKTYVVEYIQFNKNGKHFDYSSVNSGSTMREFATLDGATNYFNSIKNDLVAGEGYFVNEVLKDGEGDFLEANYIFGVDYSQI